MRKKQKGYGEFVRGLSLPSLTIQPLVQHHLTYKDSGGGAASVAECSSGRMSDADDAISTCTSVPSFSSEDVPGECFDADYSEFFSGSDEFCATSALPDDIPGQISWLDSSGLDSSTLELDFTLFDTADLAGDILSLALNM
jgi:hypothetical protein